MTAESLAAIAGVLDAHRLNREGQCSASGCDWRGTVDVPLIEFLAAHRAHVAAALVAAGWRSAEEIAEIEAERDRLRAWKREALPLFDGLQDLGRALDLPLGVLITGPVAIKAAEQIGAEARGWQRDAAEHATRATAAAYALNVVRRERDQLREAIAQSEAERDDLDTAVGTLLGENVELRAERDELAAAVARVAMWCVEQDALSKGESMTTRAVRSRLARTEGDCRG
jgi:hypothetical protein